MIGIAFTGSGKTLAFCLPLIMLALEDESKLPFVRGEGPVGVILCPSRELASQTYENVLQWTEALSNSGNYPRLNTLLCMGGISMGDQSHVLSKGIHIVVATPGRLIDMLEKRKLNFDSCKYFCMDEADRMVDLGFEDDVRNIMSFFKVMNSALLSTAILICPYSAKDKRCFSPPQCLGRFKISRSNLSSVLFLSTLVGRVLPTSTSCRLSNMSNRRPRWSICLNACKRLPLQSSFSATTRTRLTIYRSIYFSKELRLLPSMGQRVCLFRGFAIQLLIIVSAQEERQYAIKSFKSGAKDVMVASGIASKGLDFNDIQHVIIFSMPKEIEDYVHQIGRTGRSGKTGIATTFVNMNTPEQTLLDLKYLLMEAGQKCVSIEPVSGITNN